MNDVINIEKCQELKYMSITLLTSQLRVGIIGGGNAGYIKAKTFSSRGSTVDVISLDFIESFNNIHKEVNLVRKSYEVEFVYNKHIIIIAVGDVKLRNEIRADCLEFSKIYIDCAEYRGGMALLPVQRETKSSLVAVNTKYTNPKGAIYLADILEERTREEDDFIKYTSKIRNNIKEYTNIKVQVAGFINNDDFKYIYNKGKGDLVLKMFYKNIDEVLR